MCTGIDLWVAAQAGGPYKLRAPPQVRELSACCLCKHLSEWFAVMELHSSNEEDEEMSIDIEIDENEDANNEGEAAVAI